MCVKNRYAKSKSTNFSCSPVHFSINRERYIQLCSDSYKQNCQVHAEAPLKIWSSVFCSLHIQLTASLLNYDSKIQTIALASEKMTNREKGLLQSLGRKLQEDAVIRYTKREG